MYCLQENFEGVLLCPGHTEIGTLELTRLPHLTELTLTNCHMEMTDLSEVALLSGLQKINLSGSFPALGDSEVLLV